MKIETTKVVLTKLRTSWWYGNHTAKGLENDLAEENDGEAAAFRVQLKCMPPEIRTAMSEVTREMQDTWKARTLPFEEGGWRIMRADKYEETSRRLNELAAKRREVVDYIVAHYDDVVAYAKRALGKAYKESMVPPREQIVRAFGTWFRAKPVPTAADIRLLNINADVQAEMEAQLAAQISEAEALMKNEVRERLGHFIREITTRLENHKKGSGVRYGALLKSLGKYAKQFRELGLLDADALLVRIEEAAETSAKDVRDEPHIRKAMKKELDAVATAVEDVFA